MKSCSKFINCTYDRINKERHQIVVYNFSSKDDEYIKALEKAAELSKRVNRSGPDGLIRQFQTIYANIFAGCLAEAAVKDLLNSYFKINNRDDILAHEISFNSDNDIDQIDLGVSRGKITKTIEVRSSYSYAKDTNRIYNEWFSLVGYYSTGYKPMERLKDYYITAIFRFNAGKMPMIIAKKSDVSLHLAAGASAQLLHDIGEWDNLKNENANYRVIKPIIKAWSIYETANSIINSF